MLDQTLEKDFQMVADESGKRLRVLIMTENVSLRMSGETSVPYYYFKLLQERGVDVWMVCHGRTREELRELFPPEIFERIHFVDDTPFQAAVWRFSKLFPYRVEDLIFGRILHIITQFQGRKVALDVIRNHQIDIIFEPSPISPKGLSFMYDMGVPVVVGPMCGGLNLPPAFSYMDSRFTRLSILLGRQVSWIGHWLVPGKIKADALLVGNQRTAKALPQGYRGKVYEVVESGVDLARWDPKQYSPAPPDQPVRFVFCGRLVDWKGAQFLVEAFKLVAERTNSILEIIGDGELRDEIADKVVKLGIQNQVNLRGRLPLAECMELITSSDVYVMPSLRECGGLALLESMAIGLPIIAANWAGPAEYLNDSCGVLVDPSSPEGFVEGLADAMINLAKSPELRHKLGKGAQERVRQNYFDWDSKTDRVLEILKETLARVR